MSLEDRVQREKEIYNEGLKRKWFRKMHSYANAFYGDYWAETEAKTIRRANAGKLLEVGQPKLGGECRRDRLSTCRTPLYQHIGSGT